VTEAAQDDIAKVEGSHTENFLAQLLQRRPVKPAIIATKAAE
jgi:hypothetical protein